MSDEQNTTQAGLSAEELQLIAAHRTGNKEAVAEILGGNAIAFKHAFEDGFDSAERLAFHIVGELGLRGCWTRPLLQDDGLSFIWRTVVAAIKSGLPHLDIVEIDYMHERER